MNAIEIHGVTKAFGRDRAVNDLSLDVPEGAIYGFIGPNGSGKTTTIRMTMNIIRPDAGTIAILGRPASAASRDDVGYLPEERGLYKKMQVSRLLRYYGQLKGRSLTDINPAITSWLGRMQLSAWADKRIDQLSKGMAQKVQFLAAVIHRPRLLILDEPFSGLDPVNAEALRDAVLDLRREGTTVVFSTHDMPAAEKLCDRLFMIFRGNKVLDGTLDEIQTRYGHDTIRIRTTAGAEVLAGMTDIEVVNDHGNFQDVRLRGNPQAFLHQLMARTEVRHFEIAKPSLADIFVRIARPAESGRVPADAAVAMDVAP